MDGEPGKHQQMMSGLEIAKDPFVLTFRIKASPITRRQPVPGLIGMRMFDMSHGTDKHPTIQFREGFGGRTVAKVICPTAHDRIQFRQHIIDVIAA